MKFAIISSKQDEAGLNIASALKELKISHSIIKENSIYVENIDKNPEFKDADFIIFATKHQSEKHSKTLTIHAPGNWKKADFGGKEGKICPTSAFVLKHFFTILNKENIKEKSEYQVSMECTHHGPLIEKPCLFIEIGSGKDEWNDKKAGQIIAKTIQRAIKEKVQTNFIPVIGIGGPHYCPNFNKIQLGEKYAVSHIIPEYIFPLTKEIIEEAVEKTQEKTDSVIIDWKGTGKSEQRQELINMLESLNLKVLRSDQLEK
ncbi:MAG: D-aminoacyl-tRNA deacylase [Nanoarchaeota archaeon]|nr:D-aminoacyl-tRNA deacylase [Nanoarchaeota archaeon]